MNETALNRNDIAAAVQAFDAEFEWVEPDEYPGAGTCRGPGESDGPFSVGARKVGGGEV